MLCSNTLIFNSPLLGPFQSIADTWQYEQVWRRTLLIPSHQSSVTGQDRPTRDSVSDRILNQLLRGHQVGTASAVMTPDRSSTQQWDDTSTEDPTQAAGWPGPRGPDHHHGAFVDRTAWNGSHLGADLRSVQHSFLVDFITNISFSGLASLIVLFFYIIGISWKLFKIHRGVYVEEEPVFLKYK